jgi:hypothetical protein
VGTLIQRLDLLGYPFYKLSQLLHEYFTSFPGLHSDLKIDCTRFISTLSSLDIETIEWEEHEGDADIGEFFQRRILPIPQFSPLKGLINHVKCYDYLILEQIDPLIILSSVANNPKNQDLYLEWRVDKEVLVEDELLLGGPDAFLIVTEGVSDTNILRKAIQLLKPDVYDFFQFVDMEKNYPFTGSGNLYNFIRGLIKIGVTRNMLFIFDNDTEGHNQMRKIAALKCPYNFTFLTLPDLEECNSFDTIGPEGRSMQNINGKAVAIEMFLDLGFKASAAPVVRWTNYQKEMDQYQGALENKSEYSELFLSLNEAHLHGYKLEKLGMLVNYIITSASK